MPNKLKRVINDKTKFLDEWFAPKVAKAIRLFINDAIISVAFTIILGSAGWLILQYFKLYPEENSRQIRFMHEFEFYVFVIGMCMIGTSLLYHLGMLLFGGQDDDDDGGGGGEQDEFVLIGMLENGRYRGFYIPLSYLLNLTVSLALKQEHRISDNDVFWVAVLGHLLVLLLFFKGPRFLRSLFPVFLATKA
ncbi:MAG TPA: hypothetical protein VGJ05_03255 [Fimbriiglobus sp.]